MTAMETTAAGRTTGAEKAAILQAARAAAGPRNTMERSRGAKTAEAAYGNIR